MDIRHALVTEPVGMNSAVVVLREMKKFARFQIKKPAAASRIRTHADHVTARAVLLPFEVKVF